MRTKISPARRLSAWLIRALETPATSVVPPLRDYPVAGPPRSGPTH